MYPNYNLTYNITLKGRSDDDTNVIRFIPGYFSGELKAYDANDNALASKTNPPVVPYTCYPERKPPAFWNIPI